MILVATEDALSEAVARRMLVEAGRDERSAHYVGRRGAGYLKVNMKKFAEAAARFPVLVITDLDAGICAPKLIDQWMVKVTASAMLRLRVAVREVEAWIMADRERFADFLGVSQAKIERDTETIADPKRRLLELARGARRNIRRGLLPAPGAAAAQGFEYNTLLGTFVADTWRPAAASENNNSLRRAIINLRSD